MSATAEKLHPSCILELISTKMMGDIRESVYFHKGHNQPYITHDDKVNLVENLADDLDGLPAIRERAINQLKEMAV